MTTAGLNDVRALIEKLTKEASVLEEQLTSVRHTLEAAQHIGDVLSKEERTVNSGLAEISLAEVRACASQREVLHLYANAHSGLVHVGRVARMIYNSGMSKGKYSSIRSTLHNKMTKLPDEWEWAEPGIFRLKSQNGAYTESAQSVFRHFVSGYSNVESTDQIHSSALSKQSSLGT